MKKKICVLILGLCLASSTACGNNVTPDKSSNTPASFQKQEITENNNIIADKEKAAIRLHFTIGPGTCFWRRSVLHKFTQKCNYGDSTPA